MLDIESLGSCVSATDDELFVAVGQWLIPDSHHLSPSDVRRSVDLGRAWLANHLDELRDALCSDPGVLGARVAATADGSELVAAVIDVLSGVGHFPPVAVLGVLIVRYGLDKLCG